ncbi:MAG: methyltransferase [Pseudomonadota bacterium]
MTPIHRATLGLLCIAGALSISQAGAARAHAMPPHMPAPVDPAPAAPDRKPYEMVAFAKIKPGQVVVDYLPGKGYFTRVFSAAVGNRGKVYAATPQFYIDRLKGRALPPAVSSESGFSNVSEIVSGDDMLNAPAPADLVWTSQNYHDVHNWTGAAGAARLNKAAFMALKPGGLYVVLDHAGAAGLDADGMAKLHRIDEALVKQEVLAAGFVLDGESQALRNSADPRSANVYDPSIRGKTDQFILRFRKPG